MGRGRSKSNRKPSGTEYTTLYKSGNIKFVKKNEGAPAAPEYTLTPGRVYATIGNKNEIKYVTYFDKHTDYKKQIDVDGVPHVINGKPEPTHTHKGKPHNSKGTHNLSQKEN